MFGILSDFYLWIKAAHIISVIAWMAGIFYLPRLFVYHAEEVELGTSTDKLFQKMEFKLLKIIMNPAMISTWIFGILLALIPGVLDWSAVWVWLKLLSIVAMSGFHGWLAGQQRKISSGSQPLTGKTYRIMNEVPTVLMFIIVISIVVKPF